MNRVLRPPERTSADTIKRRLVHQRFPGLTAIFCDRDRAIHARLAFAVPDQVRGCWQGFGKCLHGEDQALGGKIQTCRGRPTHRLESSQRGLKAGQIIMTGRRGLKLGQIVNVLLRS